MPLWGVIKQKEAPFFFFRRPPSFFPSVPPRSWWVVGPLLHLMRMQKDIPLVLLLVLASSSVAVGFRAPRRQADALVAAKQPPPPPAGEPPKLVGDWTGNAYDLALGGPIGTLSGVMIGKLIRKTISTKLWSALMVFPLARRVALTAVVMDILTKAQFLTIHWDRIHACVKTVLSVDGRVTAEDLEGLISSRFFAEGGVPHAIFQKIDVNADGRLDMSDAATLYDMNRHAAIGGGAGFSLGSRAAWALGLTGALLLARRGARGRRSRRVADCARRRRSDLRPSSASSARSWAGGAAAFKAGAGEAVAMLRARDVSRVACNAASPGGVVRVRLVSANQRGPRRRRSGRLRDTRLGAARRRRRAGRAAEARGRAGRDVRLLWRSIGQGHARRADPSVYRVGRGAAVGHGGKSLCVAPSTASPPAI